MITLAKTLSTFTGSTHAVMLLVIVTAVAKPQIASAVDGGDAVKAVQSYDPRRALEPTEPDWRWILTDVYWNRAGGQVCEFRRIDGNEISRIVRPRGYGCPSKSMDPYRER